MTGRKYCRDAAVPIIFSVTGHTDIPERYAESIAKHMDDLFISFKKLYPHTELMLLSGFAEGADRIAVRSALRLGIAVGPVLPCPPEEFEESFSGFGYDSDVERSKQDFRNMLNDSRVCSPCVLHESYTGPEAYRDVGAYLISNSHVIIAVWDGNKYATGTGGTYDNIRMAYEGIDNELQKVSLPMSPVSEFSAESDVNYLNLAEDCLIYWIQSERSIDTDTLISRGIECTAGYCGAYGFIPPRMVTAEVRQFQSTRPSIIKRWTSDSGEDRSKAIKDAEVPRDGFGTDLMIRIGTYDVRPSEFNTLPLLYDDIFRNMDEFNRDAGVRKRADIGPADSSGSPLADRTLAEQGADWKNRFDLINTENGEVTPDSRVLADEGLMDDMAVRYNMANRLSLKYRDENKRSIWYIIAVSSVAAFLFQLFLMANTAAVLVGMYGLALLLEKVLNIKHMNSAEHRKFIEYRSIAECARVNYYWGILGINDSAYTQFYGFMKNETYWVRSVLKSWSSYFMNEYDVSGVDLDRRKTAVTESWITSQMKYHTWKSGVNRKLFARIDRRSVYAFAALMILSVILAAGTFTELEQFDEILVTLSMSTLEGMDINREPVHITVLTILKLLMIGLTIFSGYLLSKRDTINGGTPEQIGAKIKMFELTSVRSAKIRNDCSRIVSSYGAAADTDPAAAKAVSEARATENRDFVSLMQELGIQCIDENNDWVFDMKTRDVNTLSRQEDIKDIA